MAPNLVRYPLLVLHHLKMGQSNEWLLGTLIIVLTIWEASS